MRDEFRLFPEQASTLAGPTDAVFFFIFGVSAFFTVLIFSLVIGFAVRYRHSRTEPGPSIPAPAWLEWLWIAVPFVLAMGMFAWSADVFIRHRNAPPDAMEVHGMGKQWMWKFQHADGHREINELHIPVGRPVRVVLASQDVIHSFYIPAFRVKMDVVPGRFHTVWFEATRPGEYHLFCAEYCGTGHSRMIGRIVAMPPETFQSWLAGEKADAPPIEEGWRLFNDLGCISCHGGQGPRAPDLVGLYGKPVTLRGGAVVTATESYIRESILEPDARIVEGYDPIMPTFRGQLSEEDLLDLVAYIKSLGEGK